MEWKRINHANINFHKKVGWALKNNIDFRANSMNKYKHGHSIKITMSNN